MRSLIFMAVCVVGGLAACGGSDPAPSLTITSSATTPSNLDGAVEITAPTVFTAVLVNSTDPVSWTLAPGTGGTGTLSAMTGIHTAYSPPPGAAKATLTATAGPLTASVEIASSPTPLTDHTIPGLTGPVTVEYDAQDIPHIQCAATIDCIAVQGYVQAQDRFFPMDFLRHVARARLTELVGADGLSQDVQLRNLFVTRSGQRIEDALAASIDAPSKALLTAFTAGVNAYLDNLRAGGGKLPGEYAQLPYPIAPADIDPWTIEDTLAMARLQQFQLSETIEAETAFAQFAQVYDPTTDRFAAWIRAASPTTERAHTLEITPFHPPAAAPAAQQAAVSRMSRWKTAIAQLAKATASLKGHLLPADGSVGSNNWVIQATKSATGLAMVANDPHLSLQYPPLFHLSVMTSSNPADNLDLAGGAFPGIPGALVGRGAHVGWGVTVVGYDVTDLYMEQFLPPNMCPVAQIPCVLFNGAPVSGIPVTQTFKIRVAAGTGTDSFTTTTMTGLVIPHHGPVIVPGDPVTGKGISVRWTGHEGNTQDLRAIFGLNTAVDVDAAITALKGFSTGAQNFVLADDKGNIAYDPHALVPVRNFADVRVTAQSSLQPPWFPLKGDGSAEWGPGGTTDCASATTTAVPAACWISDDLLPQGKNPAKGYFFTANADPLGVSDDNNPLAHPPYFSFDWDDSSGFRATRIEQMIEAAITAKGSVSIDDMMAIQSDHSSRPGAAFTPVIDKIIAAMPAAERPADLVAAQTILDAWAANHWDCPSGLLGSDPKASPVDTTPAVVQSSAGCFLFHEFLRVLATNVFTDDLKVVGQGVDGLQALKAMLYMLVETPGVQASQTFCSDVDSKGKVVTVHSCEAQVATALVTAFDTLSAQVGPKTTDWVWGRVHTIQPVSLFPLVTNGFEPGPYARPGGAFTVDVGSPSLSAAGLSFPYGSGGNVRHISLMDPAKPTTKMQLPGPERDGATGLVGPDLLGQWVQNKYFDFVLGAAIDSAAVSTQSFKAP
jgi:penicillin amidase